MALDRILNHTEWNNFLRLKALKVKLTKTETRVFLVRFNQDNWLKRIEDIYQQADITFESFVRHSTNIYQKFQFNCPDCPKIGKGAGKFSVLRDWLLKEFNDQNNIINISDDNSTIRFHFETECEQTIVKSGALIRIKAPRKMGKSRLLNCVLDFAESQKYLTVHINLLQVERSKFDSLDGFLRWFCIYLSDALNLNFKLDDYWSSDRGSMLSCTRYLEMILEQFDQPLVLGLDEVDRLLNYPDISQDFFYLLRSWHEEANNDELWENLRLVVAYSTEDFGTLDINQSPFNVGFPVELKPFERSQVEDLANSYGLDFVAEEVNHLMMMLGGHPYLIDLILSNLSGNAQSSLEELLQQATTDTGIYSSFLRKHLINLQSNSQLTKIFLAILNSPKPIQVDTLLGYQLYRMGLIKWSKNNTVMPSCELFKQYFLPRLMAGS